MPLEKFHTAQITALFPAVAEVCPRGWFTHRSVWKEGRTADKLRESMNQTLCVTYPMQFHVEATGVTHGFSLCVAPPQCGGAGVAVSAAQACSAGRGLLQVQRKKITCWLKAI